MLGGAESAAGRARGLVLAVVLLAAALTLAPAAARGATFCVGIQSPGCDAQSATPQEALQEARAALSDDRVVLGPGTFEGPLSYAAGGGSGRIELVGQGPSTIVTGPPPAGLDPTLVQLWSAGLPTVVANLTVRMPAEDAGAAYTGVRADHVSGVRVASDSAQPASSSTPVGIELVSAGGWVHSSVVELVGAEHGIGVLLVSPLLGHEAEIADSRITAPVGVRSISIAFRVVRSRLLADTYGIIPCHGAVVEDSLIRVTGSGTAFADSGGTECGGGPNAVMESTIVGSGPEAGQTGVAAVASGQGPTHQVVVTLSILRALSVPISVAAGSGGTAEVQVRASDLESSRDVVAGGQAFLSISPDSLEGDPLFASELLGDYTLQPGSPAIDSSYSPSFESWESDTDLAGNPRNVDGDGDGVARRDMGAYEAPEQPDTTPPDTRIVHTSRQPRGKGHVLFVARFASTEKGSSFECRLESGRFHDCSSPFRRKLSVGRHRFEVRAVDAAGNVDPTPARAYFLVRQAKKHRHHHRPPHGHRRQL